MVEYDKPHTFTIQSLCIANLLRLGVCGSGGAKSEPDYFYIGDKSNSNEVCGETIRFHCVVFYLQVKSVPSSSFWFPAFTAKGAYVDARLATGTRHATKIIM